MSNADMVNHPPHYKDASGIEVGSVWVNGTGKTIATVIGMVEQEVCFGIYDSEHQYRQSRSCNIVVFKDSYRRLDLLVQTLNEYEANRLESE